MRVNFKVACRIGISIASVMAMTNNARAQDTSDGANDSSEIIVTAQRRAEALEDVPVSVTALSGEELGKSGVLRLEDISQISAGTVISRTGIFLQPSIRGVSTAQAAFAENNVAVYVDGFYRPSTRGLNTELANISQVQVLKGPQGTLFGRNATGGAILIQTLDPSFTEASGRVSAGYGNFDDRQLQAYISVPLSDKVAFNVAGSYHSTDGYMFDTFLNTPSTPQELYTIRAKLRLQPAERLDLILAYERSRISDARGVAITCIAYCLGTFNGDTRVERRDYKTSFTFVPTNMTTDDSVSLTARYDLGGANLNSYTFYQNEDSLLNFDIDVSPSAILANRGLENWKTFTQEVNITSDNDSKFQYTVGAYYFNTRQKSPKESITLSGTFPIVGATGQIDTDSFAFYADGTLQIGNNFYLTLGGRYVEETKKVAYTAGGVTTRPPELKASRFTPRIVARYAIDEDTNIYASFAQGFKTGLFNASAPYDPVAPEKLDAYEVGFKTRQGPIQFDAAAYYYNYRDLQVSAVIIRDNVQASITTNAASSEIYGAEAQISARLSSRLNLRANLAYTHARYKEYKAATVNVLIPAFQLNTGTCASPSGPPATVPCTQDWSGLRMVRSPDWSGNVSADYTIPLANGGEIGLAGNVSFESYRLPTVSTIGLNGTGYRYEQPATALVNLQASWKPAGSHFRFIAYGNNVTNVKWRITYAGSAIGDTQLLGPPTTYGGRVEIDF